MIAAMLVLLAMATLSGTVRLLWDMLPGGYDDEDGADG